MWAGQFSKMAKRSGLVLGGEDSIDAAGGWSEELRDSE